MRGVYASPQHQRGVEADISVFRTYSRGTGACADLPLSWVRSEWSLGYFLNLSACFSLDTGLERFYIQLISLLMNWLNTNVK